MSNGGKMIFRSTDLLLPKNQDWQKWAVIACDQFTSQIEYWEMVKNQVKNVPSTLHLMLPEVYLQGDYSSKIVDINENMQEYLKEGIFCEYRDSFIYVERTLKNGKIRKGLVGVVDLEQYDYLLNSKSAIRATEETVLDRIPPRKKIRKKALLELSHVLMLCDDYHNIIFDQVLTFKNKLPLLYDFDLMGDGGHICGYLISGEFAKQVSNVLEIYETQKAALGDLVYVVGDGNHSLATAKACYDAEKSKSGENLLSRYAMVELENIHDNSQEFKAIYRVVKNTDVDKLLSYLQKFEAYGGYPVVWYSNKLSGTLHLDRKLGLLPVGILQKALDTYLQNNFGTLDYIHGVDVVRKISNERNSIGFEFESISKDNFFSSLKKNGVLPKKTFSIGDAVEKRYYLETRLIKEYRRAKDYV